ncbi:MAG TPA: PIN domain-containing protein [Thermoanaerobaculia bacterium]|nr:PIN domain-containing protein [Thermoanaerobaculia bacterium]
MILLDTSGLIAALSPVQRHHEAAAAALRNTDPPLILSPFVLAEMDDLLHELAGVDASLRFLTEVTRRAYELAAFGSGDIARAGDVMAKHRDLEVGLADASIVVLAERYGTRDLLSLDERRFRVLRPTPRGSFRILPADL